MLGEKLARCRKAYRKRRANHEYAISMLVASKLRKIGETGAQIVGSKLNFRLSAEAGFIIGTDEECKGE